MAAAGAAGAGGQGSESLFGLSWAQRARTVIQRYNDLDNLSPEFAKLITGIGEGGAVSHAYTYRPYTDRELGHRVVVFEQQLEQITPLSTLPRRVRELAGQEEFASLRGLWPEVHRAWSTHDDRLVIWNYEWPASAPGSGAAVVGTPDPDGDVVQLDPLGHVITAVALVVPRMDMFTPAVKVRPSEYP